MVGLRLVPRRHGSALRHPGERLLDALSCCVFDLIDLSWLGSLLAAVVVIVRVAPVRDY